MTVTAPGVSCGGVGRRDADSTAGKSSKNWRSDTAPAWAHAAFAAAAAQSRLASLHSHLSPRAQDIYASLINCRCRWDRVCAITLYASRLLTLARAHDFGERVEQIDARVDLIAIDRDAFDVDAERNLPKIIVVEDPLQGIAAHL